jgi:hypothetical protein
VDELHLISVGAVRTDCTGEKSPNNSHMQHLLLAHSIDNNSTHVFVLHDFIYFLELPIRTKEHLPQLQCLTFAEEEVTGATEVPEVAGGGDVVDEDDVDDVIRAVDGGGRGIGCFSLAIVPHLRYSIPCCS